MSRRFATVVLSVLMLAALTGQGVSAVIAASPAPPDDSASIVQPIETVTRGTIIPADIAEQLVAEATRECVFCVLADWRGDGDDNVFTIDGGGQLRVDGDIVVNGPHIDGATCTPTGLYSVCGTALHLYRTGGTGDTTQLSAGRISISGGWTSNAGTRAHADALAVPCVAHPDPLGYALNGYPTSNVCIGSAPITDPLNQPGSALQPPDAFITPIPQQGVGSCPNDARVRVPTGTVASPVKLTLTQATVGGPNFIICPGLYPGGFSLFGGFGTPVHVDMIPGVYFMLGGGFQVSGAASIDGSGGIMIYNSSGASAYALPTAPWTGTLPPCTGACGPVVAAVTGPITTNIETPVTYTLTLTAPTAPSPTGTATFYNGDDVLAGCENVALAPAGIRQARATCLVTYPAFGRQFITGVYSGDAEYAPIDDDTFTDVLPNALLADGHVQICTGPTCGSVAPCTLGACTVLLHAPFGGTPFAGLLIFQDRSSALGVLIRPGAGLPACTGNWMTDGVPPDTNPVPQPCGPLGGLTGMIYAPHVRSGSGFGFDAAVEIDGDGVAILRVIAGRISLSSNAARFTDGQVPPDHLVLTPHSAEIAAGASQAYTVEAFDANGNSLGDVTGSSTFGIVPDGSCTGATCTATVAGSHTVTATNAGVTSTATLAVIPGPLDHLALLPANASIAAGGIQAYAADGRDAFDNPLGSVAGVAFTISPNGSCTNGKCTAKLAGVHTVTGTKSGLTATTTLTVTPGPLDHLVLAPATATVLAGVAQPYAAEGRDRFNNAIGDVTAGTVFTITPNGSCAGPVCTATVVGSHTVTGVNAGKTGKATLTVKAGPLDHLALAPASASIAFGGSKAYSATGRDAFNNPLGTVSGVVYTIGPDGSCAGAVCTPAAVGVHTVTGSKGGVTGTATLTVTRASPTLTYTGKTTAVHGAALTLSATLKRPGGAAIVGATVSFTVNGLTLTATTNAVGVASVASTAPATPGTYSIAVSFAGDASFTSASTSKNLVVS